ncbi:hypothetical protein L9F63_026452, partial [Diploptera punctata]
MSNMKAALVFGILCTFQVITGQTSNAALDEIQTVIGHIDYRLANLDYALRRREEYVHEAVRMASVQLDRKQSEYSGRIEICTYIHGIDESLIPACLEVAQKNIMELMADARSELENANSKEADSTNVMRSDISLAYEDQEKIKNDIYQKIEVCKTHVSEELVNDCLNDLVPDLKEREEEMAVRIEQQILSIQESMPPSYQNIQNAISIIVQDLDV